MANLGLGVTIGSNSLRAVKLRRKGEGYVVLGVFADRLDDSTRDLAGRALAARGMKVPAASVGMSGRDVIIRYTQVPPVPDWRLQNLMKFEVDEVGAQSGGDVSADYRKLDLPDPEGTRDDDTILVALARNNYVDGLIRSLDSGGLKLHAGCPNSLALFNAFAVNNTYTEDETALLVNIGGDNVDIAVQRGGELIFARNATPGGSAFTEAIQQAFSTSAGKAEKMKKTKGDVTPKGQARYPDPTSEKIANAIMGVAGQLSSQIQSTLMIAKAQTRTPDLKIDRVWLAGGGASLNGLDKYLGQAMGVPVKHLNPFEICDLSGLTPEEHEMIEAAPHEFAVAVGLAQNSLSPFAFGLEILPAPIKRARDFATKGIFAIAAGVVALGALWFLYSGRKAAAEELNAQLGQVAAEARDADNADKKLRKALESSQSLAIKHELLAQRPVPGALLAKVLHIMEQVVTKDESLRDIYLSEVRLDVTERGHSVSQWIPNGKMATGYSEYTGVRKENMARDAIVVVQGRVSGGPEAAQLFQTFYQACLSNEFGLTVTAPSQFRAPDSRGNDGRFELRFEAGSVVTLSDEDNNRESSLVLTNLSIDDAEEPTELRGTRVDGWPVVVRWESLSRAEQKRWLKELKDTAPKEDE